MAHAQHTPAPWRLNAGNETLVMGSNQRPIARAECGGTAGIKLAEAEANARLIAAAPELVEALAYLLEQTIEQDERHGIGLTEGEQEAADIARALLARIKGEAA